MNTSKYNLEAALNRGEKGEIEAWVHEFLCTEGDNVPFSEGLKLEDRHYYGPMKFELSEFSRCCGPEEELKYTIDSDGFENNVSNMVQEIRAGWKVPPLIVNYSEGVFEINDGNHRFEALVRSGIKQHYVIVWITGDKDKEMFESMYK